MKYFKFILLILFSIPTYGQIINDSILNGRYPYLYDSAKVAYYNAQMSKNNFAFCQISNKLYEPVRNESAYERGVPYINSLDISDSLIIVHFQFLDAGSQFHLGEYKIKNGALIFEYEAVTGMSFCLSLYCYVLKIPNSTNAINQVIIRDKQYKRWWKTTTTKDSRFYCIPINKSENIR